jgi:hypothetical protein
MTQDLPPRTADIFRHLQDLRSGTYEGAREWDQRVAVFRRAVSLLDPVVRRILDETNTVFLRGGGTVHLHAGDDRDGGAFGTGSCPGRSSETPQRAPAGWSLFR